MMDLMTVAIIAGAALLAWHMWLTYRSGGFARQDSDQWALCPCGHAAGLHAETSDGLRGGCMSGRSLAAGIDCYGYCKCPSTRAMVIGARQEVRR
jgi:hypothetical protein